MIPAIICDLDGCLCDISHRINYYLDGKLNEFESLLPFDKPNLAVLNVISSLEYRVLFVTARGAYLREATELWLKEFLPSRIKWDLFMRETVHNDAKAKEIIFMEKIKDRYDVFFALEDRKQCVDMWRKIGIQCWQVADGDY